MDDFWTLKTSSKRMKTLDCRDWTALPGDLLLNISDKLDRIHDLARFGLVCVSWRTTLLQNKSMLCSSRPPFLLIAPPVDRYKRDYPQHRVAYSPSENKVLPQLRLPIPRSQTCCGSSFGWLINEKQDTYRRCFHVQLQNPFLNKLVPLPSLGTLLRQQKVSPYGTHSNPYHLADKSPCIHRSALSSDPSSSDEYVVVAVMSELKGLAFFKSGSKSWTSIGKNWRKETRSFVDVIYSTKTNQFYVVATNGEVLAMDFVGEQGRDPIFTQVAPPDKDDDDNFTSTSLIEDFSSGDLYQVYIDNCNQRNSSVNNWIIRNVIYRPKFVVLKFNATDRKWTRIHNLGDKIIFYGSKGSLLRSASNCPGCQPNCIYYSSDVNEKCEILPEVRIYDMEDGSVRVHYTATASCGNILPSPIWLEPSVL